MKIAGIIAEYNPFHKGHQYQITYTREHLGADYVIIAMSGDYVQRGTPALLPKHTRAKMALKCGADLGSGASCLCINCKRRVFCKGRCAAFRKPGRCGFPVFRKRIRFHIRIKCTCLTSY